MNYIKMSPLVGLTGYGGGTSGLPVVGGASFLGTGMWYGVRGLIHLGYGGTSANTDTVEYVTINSASNSTNFGDLSDAKNGCGVTSNSVRVLFAGGYNPNLSPSKPNVIDYFTSSTIANAQDFGDMLDGNQSNSDGTIGDGQWGLFTCGYDTTSRINTIQYVTVDTTGNATDHADHSEIVNKSAQACTPTIGVIAGGQKSDNSISDTIAYFTIQSTSTAADFGNMTVAKQNFAGCSNGAKVGDTGGTRAVFAAGRNSSGTRILDIDYIDMTTTADAGDFGELTGDGGSGRSGLAAFSSPADDRGVFAGGYGNGYQNTIDYITFGNLSNATNFGDLSEGSNDSSGASGAAS